MYAQFFGNFLLSHNVLTNEQLLAALKEKDSRHMKIGTLAIHAGYMSSGEVDEVIILQTHKDRRFGEIAIEEGLLTEEQVKELLAKQSPDFLLLGQVLVDDGILSNAELESLINEYESENEIYDLDYIEEQKDVVDHLLERYLHMIGRPITEYEVAYVTLLFHNLVRFIGSDFTPVAPLHCKEYPRNICISQHISGLFDLTLYIDMPETVCIDFANRYSGEDFTELDEYVEAAIGDFINLHNGLFNVNVSNSRGVELSLDPPVREYDDLITFENEAYLMSVLYPFGTVNFIFELNSI